MIQTMTHKAKMALIRAKQLGAQGIDKTSVAVSLLFVAASSAHAVDVIDVTAATAGVDAAKTAMLTVLAAMITAYAVIWGVKKVLKLFGG